MKKILFPILLTLISVATMAQVHYYRGAYTNFSDILYTTDGKHIYRGAYTNFSDILFSFDGVIPACLLLLLTQ